jgi:hypothetical protein
MNRAGCTSHGRPKLRPLRDPADRRVAPAQRGKEAGPDFAWARLVSNQRPLACEARRSRRRRGRKYLQMRNIRLSRRPRLEVSRKTRPVMCRGDGGVNRDTRRSRSRGGSSRPTQLRAALVPNEERKRCADSTALPQRDSRRSASRRVPTTHPVRRAPHGRHAGLDSCSAASASSLSNRLSDRPRSARPPRRIPHEQSGRVRPAHESHARPLLPLTATATPPRPFRPTRVRSSRPLAKAGDGLSSARACAVSRDRGAGCGAAPA